MATKTQDPDALEKSAPRWRSSLDVGTTIVTALAAVAALVWFAMQWLQTGSPPGPPIPADPISVRGVAWKGKPNTNVVLEFSDFECPFCGTFARESVPAIQRDIIDAGLAQFGFMHYPITKIHKNAFRAAEAAVCAGRQNKFWEMHDALFARQDRLDEPSLFDRARVIGLDASVFRSCMAGQAAAEVEAHKALAEKSRVPGTPTFYVGEIQSDGQLKVFQAISAGPNAVSQLRQALSSTGSRSLWWAAAGLILLVGVAVFVRRRQK